MKVKKKWKRYVHQIALACLLICCIVTCVPQTVKAEVSVNRLQSASDWEFEKEEPDGSLTVQKIAVDSGSAPVYLIMFDYSNGQVLPLLFSKEPFSYTASYTYNGKPGSTISYDSSKDVCGHHTIYTCGIVSYSKPPTKGNYYFCLYNKVLELRDKYPEKYLTVPTCLLAEMLYDEQIPNFIESFVGDDAEGGVNNPIEDDEEIGTPIITKRRYTTIYHDTDIGNASDGKEDIDDSQFIFDWSNKTSTGFNLKNNKYHMTRIQIKVQSKCVVYSGFSHKTVKKKFDNYGEMSSEIKSALVDDTPYSIEYGTVKSMLPKTFSEKHNPLYIGRNFTFYFRVMCNESASGTGKWHCGPWRAVGLNASTTQDQTDESSNGHIDSDGKYTKDTDDGYNNSDSDSSTVDNKDDAKDQFKDDQKNGVTNGKNNKSFGWDDFKNLISECKQVPDLIKSVFSFLPDWVLDFIAVALFVWVFVILKKAAVG